MRFCRYFYFVKTGPYLSSTTMHPRECHHAGVGFLTAFHGSPGGSPGRGGESKGVGLGSGDGSRARVGADVLTRIQPSIYLMFPEEKPWRDSNRTRSDPSYPSVPLIQFSPDSIYLASNNTIGLVDTGDYVMVWVGDDYHTYDKEPHSNSNSPTGANSNSNSNSKGSVLKTGQIQILLEKLYIHAKTMAASRNPCAGVLVVKQYSPNWRLIFSRLCCAHNDSMYLLGQYCPYLTSMMMPGGTGSGTGTGSIPKKEGDMDGDIDRIQVMEEYCAYLPPTDQVSFMKCISLIVPGFIQYVINSRNNPTNPTKLPAIGSNQGVSASSDTGTGRDHNQALMEMNQSCFVTRASSSSSSGTGSDSQSVCPNIGIYRQLVELDASVSVSVSVPVSVSDTHGGAGGGELHIRNVIDAVLRPSTTSSGNSNRHVE